MGTSEQAREVVQDLQRLFSDSFELYDVLVVPALPHPSPSRGCVLQLGLLICFFLHHVVPPPPHPAATLSSMSHCVMSWLPALPHPSPTRRCVLQLGPLSFD